MTFLLELNHKSNHAAIIFITSSNRVILVRDKKNKKWMIPAGHRDHGESDLECAFREFREETSFSINPRKIIKPIVSDVKIHRDGHTTTRIYIIHSTQSFPAYDQSKVLNYETDALYFLKLSDFKKLVDDITSRYQETDSDKMGVLKVKVTGEKYTEFEKGDSIA
jgi:8-oxo-dGTP pyrophosphatase MutT (NUDIX family)